MRRIQSPCCNDNGAILMFGNDYVGASLCSVLASEPGRCARRESGSAYRAGGGDAKLLGNEGRSLLNWGAFVVGLREGRMGRGQGWGHSCRSAAIGSSLCCLHKFASRRISQDCLSFKEAEVAGAHK